MSDDFIGTVSQMTVSQMNGVFYSGSTRTNFKLKCLANFKNATVPAPISSSVNRFTQSNDDGTPPPPHLSFLLSF
jgi:hypothetical protein